MPVVRKGRKTVLRHQAISNQTQKKPRRKISQKISQKTTTPSHRSIRQRQAKLAHSIGTGHVDEDNSESDFDVARNVQKKDGTESPSQRDSGGQQDGGSQRDDRSLNTESTIVVETLAEAERRRARYRIEDDGTSDESDFSPSEGEETQSETDGIDQPRKRSRLEDGSSPNNAVVIADNQNERQNIEASSSRATPRKRASGLISRTTNMNQRRLASTRHDAGEGSSRGARDQTEPPIQYRHTLTRNVLRAGPPLGMERAQMDLAGRSKMDPGVQDSVPPSSRAENSTTGPLQRQDPGEGSSGDSQAPPSQFLLGVHEALSGAGIFNLIDCRNKQNGLGGSSRGKQAAADPSKKCQACFKFRRNCDQAKPACGSCVQTKTTCVPLKAQAQAPLPRVVAARIPQIARAPEVPLLSEFSGSQMWEKCQSCAALNKQCALADGEDDCRNCKQRRWKCRALTGPKPKKKQEYRGRNQDPNTKCVACVKARSHCDGVLPKCGHCAKWGYRCFPHGVRPPRKNPADEKCRRCRQLKLACSETLPCPRCVKKGIECGMTAREEAMQLRFLGDE